MRELSKADFTRTEWRKVVRRASAFLYAGLDGEHAARWAMEEIYEDRWPALEALVHETGTDPLPWDSQANRA